MTKSKMIHQIDCLGMGIITLDFLVTVPFLPEPGGKVDASHLCVQGGGPIPNTMVGLSRLGMKTAVIAVVGDDIAGKISIDELIKDKVDHRYVIIKKKSDSATAYGFIEEGSGRRTIALYRKIFIHPRDLQLSRYLVPRILHLDGRDLDATLKLARWGKRVGATVTFDIGSIRNDVTAVLPYIDHLVVADAFALPYTKQKSIRKALVRLSEICPGTIVITCGIKGANALENGRYYHYPAYKVQSVDTTGAGDAFHVGYLYGLLKKEPIITRLKLGSAVAALKCTKPGARGGMPTLYQLRTFLKNEPETYA